jgi:alkylation response protein AidB-like acyl-CoA dehydrogenase
VSGFLGFDYSDEQRQFQETVRRFLEDRCPPSLVRDVLDGRATHAADLWKGLAEIGCLGAAIPEAFGGVGLGPVEQGLIAHELGRVLAPVPIMSTVYLAAELVKAAGTPTQKAGLLGAIARGEMIAAVADLELDAAGRKQATTTHVTGGRLHGAKPLVADGLIADQLLVLARPEDGGPDDLALYLVPGDDAAVTGAEVATIDPTRRYARLDFHGAVAEPLGGPNQGRALLEAAHDRAAIYIACEQVGGAERALEIACAYARERHAFGRPIGSFQAVKQLLADMYVSLAIARANVKRAVWALDTDAPELKAAAARAYLSASHAFRHCGADTIQVHGGAGFVWDSQPHLFYRRAQLLSRALGAPAVWEQRLIGRLAAASEAPAAERGDDEAAAGFRAAARAWVQANAPWDIKAAIDRSPPGALEIDDDLISAQKAWQKKKSEAGWACLHWPRVHGGRGATPLERIIWRQEEGSFARLSSLFHNGQTMGAPTLMDYAGDAQKAALLPKIASGEQVWCQLFSEPSAGSDLAGLRTRARRDGDRWVIDGQKIWTSHGQDADFGILIARSDFEAPKHKGLTAFFIDMHAPGVEARPIRQMNDQSGFAEVFFTDLIIPDAQRLGEVGEGWKVALTMLSHERLAIGLEMPTGYDELFEYCAGLTLSSGPALEDPGVVSRLAGFEQRASGLHNFMLGSMARFARGELPGPENSIVKLAAGRMMQDIAAFALDLQDEAGILVGADEKGFAGRFQGMLLRAPATRIEGGSDQILRNVIAEHVLGMPPDLRVDKDRPFSQIAGAQAAPANQMSM